MEEFPRLPMLCVDLKFSASSVDFGPKLLEYIIRNYKEDATNYRLEIEALNNLREAAVKVSADLTSLSAAKRYYAQLQLLKNRFPLQENGAAAVTFTWLEKYADIPLPVSAADVDFELACILHNIGAVHSQLGANDSRLSLEGMKEACTHFQCAGWAFEQLANEFKIPSKYSQDLDPGLFSWQKLLMLAQECILEKSLIDNRKCVVVGKVAVEVVSYYKQCAGQLEEQGIVDVVGISQFKMWKRFVQLKVHYYSALMNLYIGMQSEHEKKWGERLAYFNAAQADIASASKLLKKATDPFAAAVQFTSELIESRVSIAQKENDFVYHEKVPDYGQLAPWKGVTLVKPIMFDVSDPDVSGPEIFQKLVPMRIHKLSSIYSEKKAGILRALTSKVEEHDNAISQFLDALKLREALQEKSAFQLPEELVERCAAFQVDSDNVYKLRILLDGFVKISKCLENDVAKAQLRAIPLLQELRGMKTIKKEELVKLENLHESVRTDCKKCTHALEDAVNIDDRISSVLTSLLENLELLRLPMDKLAAKIDENPVDIRKSPETQELIRLLAKVDEMVSQRTSLIESLKKAIIEDDVSKALLAMPDDDYEDLFNVELRKHNKAIALLEQNFSAQDKIVLTTTEANARFVPLRLKAEESERLREKRIAELISAYDCFVDLQEKVREGAEFYDGCKAIVDHVKARLDVLEQACTQLRSREQKESQASNLHVPVPCRPSAPVGSMNQAVPLHAVPPTMHSSVQQIPPPQSLYVRPSTLLSGVIPSRLPRFFHSSPALFDPSSFGSSEQVPGFTLRPVNASSYLPYNGCYLSGISYQRVCGYPAQSHNMPPQFLAGDWGATKVRGIVPSQSTMNSSANLPVVTTSRDTKAVPSSLVSVENIMSAIEGTIAADLPPPILPTPSSVSVAKNAGSCVAERPDHLAAAAATVATSDVSEPVAKETVAPVDRETGRVDLSEQTALNSLQQLTVGVAHCPEHSERPVGNPEKLSQDAARFEKLVETLDRRSLNGPTLLELNWKEIMEHCEAELRKHTISIAKCYPFKNRVPELLPYDDSRVTLQAAKNDYINASFVKNICEHGPNFIITQAATSQSIEDFWLMIFEQNVELICSVMSTSEVKGKPIWPEENEPIRTLHLCVTVVNKKIHPCFTERLVSITHGKTSLVRCVVHLQYSAWIHGSALSTLSSFVDFIIFARSHYLVQRLCVHPICVQSLYGSSRSGVFCLTLSVVHEVMTSGLLPQINPLVEKLWTYRKRCIADAQDLQSCYVLISSFLGRLLAKKSQTVSEADNRKTGGAGIDDSIDPFAELRQPFAVCQKAVNTTESIPQALEEPRPKVTASPRPKDETRMDVIAGKACLSNRLLDLTDPEKFTLDLPPTCKRKTTKQDFLNVQFTASSVAPEQSPGNSSASTGK